MIVTRFTALRYLAAFAIFTITGTWAATASTPVIVDPATPMTTGVNFAAEWNTAGALESWSGINATVNANGTALAGTATTNDPRVQRSNIPGGPDLDLGWNDFLELRIQVPAAYNGAIQVYYGTTATIGFSSDRILTIPAEIIPKDGAFHTYRFDLGLEVRWRSTLRDLRIDPVDGTSASGMAFEIDYIRVGDEPNATVYQTHTSFECPAAGGTTPPAATFGGGQTVLSMESKHFRILWNSGVEAHGSWNANIPRGTLRNMEEIWQVYVKKLGYVQPNQTIGNPSSTSKYRLNVLTWYSGYWAGVNENFAYLNVTPDGLRVDPPSGVLAHEGMHCFQFHTNGGNMPGEWYEFHANYGRERYLDHYRALFPNESGIDPNYLRCGHQTIEDGRHYYLSWPLLVYLDENPDALADIGEGTVAELWKQTQANEYPLMALERLTPSTSLKDIAGYFGRRQATLDYANQTAMNATLATFGLPVDNAATSRWRFTDLVQRSDDSTWWRVPYEMAPMQGAYAIHELVPAGTGTGRVVTVNLRGLTDSARGADWRASFIVIADDGTERYSTLWGGGTNSVTLAANENKVYLSVAGAPGVFYYGGTDDVAYPYRSHPSKSRFPYEIQVTGATPKQRDNGGTSGLTQHSNGGGWRSVSVPSSVYIGPNARVLGGTVSDNARIEDYSVVSSGTVNGNAVISGHAWVRGGTVTDNAKVRDWALVEGGTINGSARVLEHANIKGGTVQDIATAKGTAASLSGTLSGNAIIDGNYGDFFSGRDVANGVAYGHVPYVGVPDSHIRPLPGGLYAAYEFDTAHDSRILDSPGVTDGFTFGSPAWVSADAKRKGFLTFDGTSQHVNLDRSVTDLRDFTFTAWVKPLGGPANQSVLWLGASATKRLYFTPDDGAGHAKFAIVSSGSEQTLTSSAPLTPGLWSHVAVTLDGTTGTLYLNGVAAAIGPVSLRPDQLLAANTATSLQHNYLAKSGGDVLPRFRGALDGVRFYGTALSAADISAMQEVTTLATAGTLYVDLRASDASAGASTWINNGTIGNFSSNGSPSKTTVAGIPAVTFNGSNQAYTGPNTVSDIDAASDRSIEVWAYNPALAEEETAVSWAYRGGSPDGSQMAFNFGSNGTWGAVTHWGGGYDTNWGGAAPSAGAWHHLVYTYDGGTTVKIYIDGNLTNTRTLAGPLATWASQAINLACQRNTAGGTRGNYFSGSLNTVRVHGGVLSAAQVAGNFSLGPAGAPGNSVPAANPQSVNVNESSSVPVTLNGTDVDGNPLAFIIASQPTHGTLGGAAPNLTYSPVVGYRGSDAFSFTTSDGAAISAPATVTITVNPVYTPTELWRQSNFGANWNNPAVSGDAVDVDHDGLNNLLEYALGSNPNSNSPAAAPQVSTATGRLKIAFTRNTAATDITLSVVATDSPAGPWDEIARSTNGAAFTAIAPGAVVNEAGDGPLKNIDSTDIVLITDPAHPKRFMRLEVHR